jgi:hypothetical protein
MASHVITEASEVDIKLFFVLTAIGMCFEVEHLLGLGMRLSSSSEMTVGKRLTLA